jgi:hypothetical protein
MRGQQINRVTSKAVLALSLIALIAVLSGYAQPPQPDEGTAGHIFQLAILLLLPMIFLFIATSDWTRPARSARPQALPATLLVLACGAVYYLEHWR